MPQFLNSALSGFHFHVTTACVILRHRAFEIGKQD